MATYKADSHFVPVPYSLLDDPNIQSKHIAVYVACRSFCDYGSEEGAEVRDEVAAPRAGLSISVFTRVRAELRKMKWLNWQRTGRGNIYTVRSVNLTEQNCQNPTPQIGQSDGSDPPLQQNTLSSKHQEPLPIKHCDKSPILTPRIVTRKTWISPFFDQHLKILGGEMQVSKVAEVFKRLIELHGEAEVLKRQRHYLEYLVKGDTVRFLNYANWSTIFGTFEFTSEEFKGRPTQNTSGKDFTA